MGLYLTLGAAAVGRGGVGSAVLTGVRMPLNDHIVPPTHHPEGRATMHWVVFGSDTPEAA